MTRGTALTATQAATLTTTHSGLRFCRLRPLFITRHSRRGFGLRGKTPDGPGKFPLRLLPLVIPKFLNIIKDTKKWTHHDETKNTVIIFTPREPLTTNPLTLLYTPPRRPTRSRRGICNATKIHFRPVPPPAHDTSTDTWQAILCTRHNGQPVPYKEEARPQQTRRDETYTRNISRNMRPEKLPKRCLFQNKKYLCSVIVI